MSELANPFELFCAATGHWKSAARLGRAKNDKHYGLSMLVLEAFSLELYLKCLHVIRGEWQGGHNADVLFERLNDSDRSGI